MSQNPSIGVPAGWYVDPVDPRAQRWWNGVAWTDHVHSPEAEPGANSAEPPTSGGRHVSTEMTLSISSFVDGRYPRHRREVTAVA